ncbi:fluoride efflux transporter CrcB [Protaetiibacter larvae]|uniref:Fluoride-specific ion channel FluC n=1 Tax=Protaetiibacter larvae TaxID=2592654 RepID=A0A5C1YA52_9MICO|nr:fluoride efflux transporter CrcB [Protaetiibacter larvae]QEO09762.1 fluoride efflux transporter CrcB [Protaetiibacter larvae]
MTPLVFAVVALAGGVGAVARFALDGFISSRFAGSLPLGTIAINLSGSLVLGLLAGFGAGALPHEWMLVLGTGFVGGYTTFSTASFQTVHLLQERKWIAALLNGLIQLVAATALAAFGVWLGALLV